MAPLAPQGPSLPRRRPSTKIRALIERYEATADSPGLGPTSPLSAPSVSPRPNDTSPLPSGSTAGKVWKSSMPVAPAQLGLASSSSPRLAILPGRGDERETAVVQCDVGRMNWTPTSPRTGRQSALPHTTDTSIGGASKSPPASAPSTASPLDRFSAKRPPPLPASILASAPSSPRARVLDGLPWSGSADELPFRPHPLLAASRETMEKAVDATPQPPVWSDSKRNSLVAAKTPPPPSSLEGKSNPHPLTVEMAGVGSQSVFRPPAVHKPTRIATLNEPGDRRPEIAPGYTLIRSSIDTPAQSRQGGEAVRRDVTVQETTRMNGSNEVSDDNVLPGMPPPDGLPSSAVASRNVPAAPARGAYAADEDEDNIQKPFLDSPGTGLPPSSNLPLSLSALGSERTLVSPAVPSPQAILVPAHADEAPIAAASVFSASAPPIDLAELDAYLSDPALFAEPQFSGIVDVCTLEEINDYKLAVGTSQDTEKSGWWCFGRRSAILQHARPGRSVSNESAKGTPTFDDGEEFRAEKAEEGNGPEAASPPAAVDSAFIPARRKLVDKFPPLQLIPPGTTLREFKSNTAGAGTQPFSWFNPSVIGGSIIDILIGVEGSSMSLTLFRLEVLRDFFQLMAATLHSSTNTTDPNTYSLWRRILVIYIPSFLALDFVSVFGKAILFFLVWQVVTYAGLWLFFLMTRDYNPNTNVEGFDSQPWIFSTGKRGTRAINVAVVFVLTTLYMPLTKIAVDALTWQEDFWPVANPYINGTVNPSALKPLGPPDEYRDPLDFCYTTTMRKDQFNFAYLVLFLSVITICAYTFWFPWRLWKTVMKTLPTVSRYTELGEKRSESDMEIEYYKLLDRDQSPLNFLYNDYRRQWGGYKALYLIAFKLPSVLVMSVFTPNNCLFRNQSSTTMNIAQTSILIGLTSVQLVLHLRMHAFVDAISNRSELVSRMAYVATSVIGLLVALAVKGANVFNTAVYYLIEALSYGSVVYFSLVSMGFSQKWIKIAQKRIDFSVDIFSPKLNLRKHIKRRIWEETLSTILLASPVYRMPKSQKVYFSQSHDDGWPPYLLNFQGSVAERHAENLKIVLDIGIVEYRKSLERERSHEERLRIAMHIIQARYSGPDCFWRPREGPTCEGVTTWFGKAFLVPFPVTLVFRYDQNVKTICLTTLAELEEYIMQNEHEEIKRRRMVRYALRALDGKDILRPYSAAKGAVRPSRWWMFGRSQRYTSLEAPVYYRCGTLKVHRMEHVDAEGYNFNSGFDVTLTYKDGQYQLLDGRVGYAAPLTVRAGTLGITDDFKMTTPLLHLLRDNEKLVDEGVPIVRQLMQGYREHYMREAEHKRAVMSYGFLADIFDNSSLSSKELEVVFSEAACCHALRELPKRYEGALQMMHERMAVVNKSPVHQWWWLFWDDMWRKNASTISQMRKHKRSFSPHYPHSICYRPCSRPALVQYLEERGLWKKEGKVGFFNNGLLNCIYFYLDELVFRDRPSQPIQLLTPEGHHVGSFRFPHSDASKQSNSLDSSRQHGSHQTTGTSSRFTGGGTNHDYSAILQRPAFEWQQRLLERDGRWAHFKERAMEWLDLHPYIFEYSYSGRSGKGRKCGKKARHRAGAVYLGLRRDGDLLEVISDDEESDGTFQRNSWQTLAAPGAVAEQKSE